MPTVRFRLLHPNARAPEYQTAGASGMDLYAVDSVWIEPGETKLIPLGLAVELPDGHEAQIRPRSSLSKRGCLGHFGTIDQDYRGELAAVLTNTTPTHWPTTFRIARGDRIAQLVIAPVARVEMVAAEVLSETTRGAGGFGHTGR